MELASLLSEMTGISPSALTLFLCGDVMTGRGVDQILHHPSRPELHEESIQSAVDYVSLAERVSGAIPRNAPYAYIWGDALDELERAAPDLRIANLETAVTVSEKWARKDVLYRMHPANLAVLAAAKLDACSLANNHVLDWGRPGLIETLDALKGAGIQTAGAGKNTEEARQPAIFELRSDSSSRSAQGRVIVFSFGMESAGIPPGWAAGLDSPGIDFLADFSRPSLHSIAQRIRRLRRPGDLIITSIHWGSNWGYEIADDQCRFARSLIDEAGVDVVHGHSSHHIKGFELHRGKLILHGCGDFISDYEGIGGYDEFRGDLVLMYLVKIDRSSGKLLAMRMVPFQSKRFRLQRASPTDTQWIRSVLERECRIPRATVKIASDLSLNLEFE